MDVVHCVDSYHLLHPDAPPMAFAEHPRVVRHELRSGYGALSPLLTQQTGGPTSSAAPFARSSSPRLRCNPLPQYLPVGAGILSITPERGRPVKMYTTHEHWLICPTHVLWKYD